MKQKFKINGVTVFLLAFAMAAMCFLPFLLRDGGLFLYFGDYNAQQIPFYIKVHDAVRSGRFFFDMKTDLGSSIYTSYSFYLLGSPFFWLTIPFSGKTVPYIMPVLMMLKLALASLGGYLYCGNYVKNPKSACTGGLLYGFSGFAAVSLVFNHFEDVVALFPFFLLLAEKLIQKQKYGYFACMTAIMALTNYFFFAGAVVFLVIYVAMRYIPDKTMSSKEKLSCFARLGIEGLLGTMISCFLLYPSLLAVAGNQRVSETIFSKNPLFYGNVKTYLALLKNLFLPPDIINGTTLFGTQEGAVASVSLFLPLFTISGVTAYFVQKKGMDFPKRLLLVCLFLALFPLGNSLFAAANATYYARWFFMPLLVMAAITAAAIEDFNQKAFSIGTLLFGAMLLIFLLIGMITKSPLVDSRELFLIENRSDYELELTIGIGSFFILVYLVWILQKDAKKKYLSAFLTGTVLCCVATMTAHIHTGYSKVTDIGRSTYKEQSFSEAAVLNPTADNFFRIETDDSDSNYGMFHEIPSVSCFLSTVSGSIMDFYQFAGIERNVKSRIPYDRPGIRSLLSVRYFLQNIICAEDYAFANQELLMGYQEAERKNGFQLYENTNYLHMGVIFTYYMKQTEYEKLSETEKDLALVYTLVVEDKEETILKMTAGMQELSASAFQQLQAENEASFAAQCQQLNQTAADRFTYTDTLLQLDYSPAKSGTVFLSVPYSSGFTAYVDNEAVDILIVDGGLMAIPLSEGAHTITLTYEEPGLFVGTIISITGFCLLSVWLLLHRHLLRSTGRVAP